MSKHFAEYVIIVMMSLRTVTSISFYLDSANINRVFTWNNCYALGNYTSRKSVVWPTNYICHEAMFKTFIMNAIEHRTSNDSIIGIPSLTIDLYMYWIICYNLWNNWMTRARFLFIQPSSRTFNLPFNGLTRKHG